MNAPRVTTLAGFWPLRRLDNAGSVFLLRHVNALSAAGCRATLLIPDRSACDPHAVGLDPAVRVVRLATPPPARGVRRVVSVATRFGSGELSPGRDVLRAWAADPRFAAAVAGADVVEIHWAEFLAAGRLVRAVAPTVVLAAVDHDVKWQNLARRAAGTPDRARRLLARVAAPIARRREPRVLNRFDVVLTPSEKDRQLLAALGVTVPVLLRSPWVPEPLPAPPLADRDPVVLFTGYLARPENDASARWLLDAVWPRVRAAVPSARLVVAGADPTPALAARAGGDVVVTGYVPDLRDCYARARVFVVPLVMGAGIKTKVPEAMLAGVPVVATRIGAEGMPVEPFAAVTDDAAALAAALVRCLTDPAHAAAAGARGRAFAESLAAGYADETRAIVDAYAGAAPAARR